MRRPLNECTACGEDFTSVRLFDQHRVGKHEYTFLEGMRRDPPVEDGRRCLGVDEMEERGWEQDDKGRWRNPVEIARGKKALARSKGQTQE